MAEEERQGPAWRVIAAQLRSDVADEVYPPGGPLPGESQLATRYKVSRPTVRRAISALVGEGLLSVAHGRGTFVRPRPNRRVILTNDPEPVDLLDEAYEPSAQGWLRGEHPRAIALGRDIDRAKGALITKAGRDQAEALGTRTGTWVIHRFQHWRHRTTHQIISVESIMPAHVMGWLSGAHPERPPEPLLPDEWQPDEPGHPYELWPVPDDESSEGEGHVDWPEGSEPGRLRSLYERLKDQGPVRFVGCVTARMPVGDEVTDLDVPTGTAVLEIRRTMTDPNGRPLEVTMVTAPADRFEAASAPEWLAATRNTGSDAAAVLRL